MKCQICKHGETQPGTTSTIFERHNSMLIFKKIPAHVCENCGESYLDEDTSRQLLKIAQEAVQSGVKVEICEFDSVLV